MTNDTNQTIPILDQIYNKEISIHDLSLNQLEVLCQELRTETIQAVAETGGHLGAGLGVIELTVAIHHVFNTPKDLLIWDVGHQAYPHKILTDRRPLINTLRKAGGLSGFPKRTESPYDAFGTAHSSTSISAALGMAVARDHQNENHEVIAVIGDGAMSAGMAYEALNNAGSMNNRLIVILNDNDMSIARPVGALSNYLSRLISSSPYLNFRDKAKKILKFLPDSVGKVVKKAESMAKSIAQGGNFFEEFGFFYLGPIDGHNLENLVIILQNIRDDKMVKHPVLLHIVTEKGKGFISKDSSDDKFHAVNTFDPKTGIQHKMAPKPASYTRVFADSLIKIAKNDSKIVAITAAMPSGTGLDLFARNFPDRCFDVAIAEQHAVTFAAGLACSGLKPFVALYSTFLQRAYDQVVHDVALQKLPVRFAIDRAGVVGADGPTHAGSFDITYLATLPNFIIMAPSDEIELQSMVATSALIDDAPSAFRYPRGDSLGLILPEIPEILEIGKGRIITEGNKIAILSLGTRLAEAKIAANILAAEHNLKITIADARFAKPIDYALVKMLAENHSILITIEENSIGGFGAHILDYLSRNDLTQKLKFRSLHLPDLFLDHDSQHALYEKAGLNASGIVDIILKALHQ